MREPAVRILESLRSQLYSAGVLTEFRRSLRNVPHIVTTNVDEKHPCYFRRDKVFRCFHPWPSNGVQQTRYTSPVVDDIISYVKNIHNGVRLGPNDV